MPAKHEITYSYKMSDDSNEMVLRYKSEMNDIRGRLVKLWRESLVGKKVIKVRNSIQDRLNAIEGE